MTPPSLHLLKKNSFLLSHFESKVSESASLEPFSSCVGVVTRKTEARYLCISESAFLLCIVLLSMEIAVIFRLPRRQTHPDGALRSGSAVWQATSSGDVARYFPVFGLAASEQMLWHMFEQQHVETANVSVWKELSVYRACVCVCDSSVCRRRMSVWIHLTSWVPVSWKLLTWLKPLCARVCLCVWERQTMRHTEDAQKKP